jgi:hypothetical protein
MIAEWANLVMMEATAGRTCASCAQVIAWQRKDDAAGMRDLVAIYLTGEFYLNACTQEPPQLVGQLRLGAAELEQVYGWMDTLEPVDEQTEEAGVAMHRQLWATGSTPAVQADKEAMDAMIMGLIEQVAPQ